MAGHQGLAMVYGRNRKKAEKKKMKPCAEGKHYNCFSMNCTCECHGRHERVRDARKAEAPA